MPNPNTPSLKSIHDAERRKHIFQGAALFALVIAVSIGLLILRHFQQQRAADQAMAALEAESITLLEQTINLPSELAAKSLTVTEVINFTSQHHNVVHGLRRFLWSKYFPDSAEPVDLRYSMNFIKLDGSPYSYNGPADDPSFTYFELGDSRELASGPHTYEIQYSTNPLELRRPDNHELLVWSSTTPMDFLVKRVRVTVLLPSYVSDVSESPVGWITSRETSADQFNDVRLTVPVKTTWQPKKTTGHASAPTTVVIETTAPLYPMQYLSFRIAW